MVQNKLRFVQKLLERGQGSDQLQDAVQNLLCLTEVLSLLMSNPNADVRKCVVFCMVEIHSIVQDDDLFQEAFLNKLNQS